MGASAEILQVLEEIDLFANLPREQLEEIATNLHEKRFPPGATIMSVEQLGEVVYVIVDGTVKVHVEQADGSDVIISILGAGDIVGEMSVLDNAGRSASVVTLEESRLLWMDRRVFADLLSTVPQLTYNLARVLADRLRMADEQIQALAALEVECRVARQLLAFADRYGYEGEDGVTVIPIRLTQGDIASMVGASRERINKVMVAYKERNFIAVDQNHHITVLKRSALEKRLV